MKVKNIISTYLYAEKNDKQNIIKAIENIKNSF